MNGLVMIGHKQDTDSEDESGDLRVVHASGLVEGRGWGFEDDKNTKGSLNGFVDILEQTYGHGGF